MKKILVVLLALLLASCSHNGNSKKGGKSSPAANQSVQSHGAAIHAVYTPDQALGLIQQKKNLLIIDVRSPEELKEGRLQNSILIPIWNIMRGEYNLPKDRPILLVCAVGGRSYAAMQMLAHNGYPELYSLKGGLDEWKKEGLPVVY